MADPLATADFNWPFESTVSRLEPDEAALTPDADTALTVASPTAPVRSKRRFDETTVPGTIVVEETGAGATTPLRQVEPGATSNWTRSPQDPKPFLFLDRTVTATVVLATRPLTVQLVALPAAIHEPVPTRTCDANTGDFRWVIARLNVTVTSTFPERLCAEIEVTVGLLGFAETEIASADPTITPTKANDMKQLTVAALLRDVIYSI